MSHSRFWQAFHLIDHRTEFGYVDKLLHSLPTDLDALRQLKLLYLYQNQIRSLPAEIGCLHLLIKLHIGTNQLTSLPNEIGQLHALEELIVSNNRLRSLPTTIGNLHSLVNFSIDGNRITSLPQSIGQLRSLNMFNVSWNRLNELPIEIGQLQSLCRLFLHNNALRGLPLNLLVKLPTLRSVSHFGNPLDNMPTLISLEWCDAECVYQNHRHARLQFVRERQRLGAVLLVVLSTINATIQFAEPVCLSIFRHLVNDLVDDDELVRCVHRMCVSCARVFSQRELKFINP